MFVCGMVGGVRETVITIFRNHSIPFGLLSPVTRGSLTVSPADQARLSL
jgi:hypothetical protein